MDKKYVTLFKDLAQATAASAESVMDYDRSQNDEEGLKTATIMRDDYQKLTDKIIDAGDAYVPNKDEVAKLLVGAMIQVNQIQDKINNLKKAMIGFQTHTIPKLQKILDEAKDDDDARNMANLSFILENNN